MWLPDVLRAAGLDVDMYPGWETRGSESWGPLRGTIEHATASALTSTDAGDMRVLWITGSVTAPPPISQCFLSRSGRWVVGASGRCNHVLRGDKGPHEGYGNYQLIGIEAQNDNRGEPWSAHMLDSYQRGVAAIHRHEGWPAWRAVAHREHQTGKSDPFGIDMIAFRSAVGAILTGEEDMTPEQERWLYNLDRLDVALLTDADSVTQVKLQNGTLNDFPLMVVRRQKAILQALAALSSGSALTPEQVAVIAAAAKAGAEAGAPTEAELVEAARKGAELAEDS